MEFILYPKIKQTTLNQKSRCNTQIIFLIYSSKQLNEQSNLKQVAMEAYAISVILLKQYKYLKSEIKEFEISLISEQKKERKPHQNPRTTTTKKKEPQQLFRLQLDDTQLTIQRRLEMSQTLSSQQSLQLEEEQPEQIRNVQFESEVVIQNHLEGLNMQFQMPPIPQIIKNNPFEELMNLQIEQYGELEEYVMNQNSKSSRKRRSKNGSKATTIILDRKTKFTQRQIEHNEENLIREIKNKIEQFKQRKNYDDLENILINPFNDKSLFNDSGDYSKRVSEQFVREGQEREKSQSNIFNFEQEQEEIPIEQQNQQVGKMGTIQETLSANYLSATSFIEHTHVLNEELRQSTAREKAIYFLKILTVVQKNSNYKMVQEDKLNFGDIKLIRLK